MDRVYMWALVISAWVGISVAVYGFVQPPTIPACPEDAVLVGTGTFDGNRWTGYECGPAVDDYTY